ncbi:hypothetical protein [uncultured Methylibium sp.]|uniref:hypothetical protein n=1 Tax=uncultured Methylibium sp. TaxID=381093 RepID=UPI0025EEC1A8|nr:hypothetical protein [uncultured Methylibium sp.]
MDKSHPPESFGVFSPVGHTVLAFRSAAGMEAAAAALGLAGFDVEALTRYTPQEMVAQADADLRNASPMASLGQDLNLVKAHRDLARSGCSFLVVPTPDEERARRVADLAAATGAAAARRYGRFLVEELVDRTAGEVQSFESPARGLDVDDEGKAAS